MSCFLHARSGWQFWFERSGPTTKNTYFFFPMEFSIRLSRMTKAVPRARRVFRRRLSPTLQAGSEKDDGKKAEPSSEPEDFWTFICNIYSSKRLRKVSSEAKYQIVFIDEYWRRIIVFSNILIIASGVSNCF